MRERRLMSRLFAPLLKGASGWKQGLTVDNVLHSYIENAGTSTYISLPVAILWVKEHFREAVKRNPRIRPDIATDDKKTIEAVLEKLGGGVLWTRDDVVRFETWVSAFQIREDIRADIVSGLWAAVCLRSVLPRRCPPRRTSGRSVYPPSSALTTTTSSESASREAS